MTFLSDRADDWQSRQASGEDPPHREVLRVPRGHCPKCLERRRSPAGACPKCGLARDDYRPEPCPPALVEHFSELLEAWERPDLHDEFVAEAARRRHLGAAGRLYRLRLARHPDDPHAKRGVAEVVRMATGAVVGMLNASATGQHGSPSARGAIVRQLSFLGLSALAVAWLLAKAQHGLP